MGAGNIPAQVLVAYNQAGKIEAAVTADSANYFDLRRTSTPGGAR